jgi:hypothetical protein
MLLDQNLPSLDGRVFSTGIGTGRGKHNGRRAPAPKHLTQSHRREAKGRPHLHLAAPPQPPRLCRTCGAIVTAGYDRCASCRTSVSTEEPIKAAEEGRTVSHSPKAEAKRAESRRKHAAALKNWRPLDQPEWLIEQTYQLTIQPRLVEVTVPVVRMALGVSKSYATNIRIGRRLPHPRHWRTLARLVGISNPQVLT